MTEKFPWFAARLLYEACVSGKESSAALYEERIVLVYDKAGAESATKKAEKLGKAAQDEYTNEAGEAVSWEFRELLDIVQLNEITLGEGSEVYHQYLSSEALERLRESLKSSV